MNQLNKNYIKYKSNIDKHYKMCKNNNIFIKKYYNNKLRGLGKCDFISTCALNGRLKKTYKNNKVSRHFIRDEVKKTFMNT